MGQIRGDIGVLSGEKILEKEVKMKKEETVRNRQEISKMGARKQELEVEEIISWLSQASGENDES